MRIKETTQNEDLSAVVRVARVANALSFADRATITGQLPQHIAQRQQQQATFVIGGYLYDAIHLADELAETYAPMICFEGLLAFVMNAKKYRNIVAEFNFNPAFTLDWSGGVTREAVEEHYIDLESIEANCHRRELGHVYFPAIHSLDQTILAEKLAKEITEEGLVDFVREVMPLLTFLFVDGAVEFVAGICRKLELRRMTERRRVGL